MKQTIKVLTMAAAAMFALSVAADAQISVNGVNIKFGKKQSADNTEAKAAVTAAKVATTAVSKTSATQANSAAPAAPAGAGSPIKAPLPGTIIEVKVNVGDTVKQGDCVLVLEAMKMQNNIESEYEGTVTSITVKQGETVMEGAVLLTIG